MNSQTEPKSIKSDVIKFGDIIYLEHMSGRYITASDPGTNNRYDWGKGSEAASKCHVTSTNNILQSFQQKFLSIGSRIPKNSRFRASLRTARV